MHQVSTQQSDFPKWLDQNEFPFNSQYFDLPMGKMHYVDEGNGDPIVMVHGNPGWSFEYRNIIKELSNTNRCIAPDFIGFGLSDKPFDWNYLPENHADYFEQFLESLNLNNITMVVNDWGGPIGLSYAIKHPEKIKKLVILNTWMWPVNDDPHFRMFSKIMGGPVGRFMIKQFNFFGKTVVKKAMGDPKNLPESIHKHYYKHLQTKKERKGCYVFPKQIIESGNWLDSLWQQRENINNIPTTMIWGMKDIAFRAKELNFWIEHWQNPQVVKLQEVGHFPQEEAPEVVIEVLKQA